MFTLQLTREEILALGNLLDSATKYDGAKSAHIVAHLIWKLNEAKPLEEKSETPKTQK